MVDINGFIFIMAFFIISLLLGCVLLFLNKLQSKYIFSCMFFSAFFHFLGAVFYWRLTFGMPADAVGYFENSQHIYRLGSSALGTNFIMYLVRWLRAYIFGSSYLGTYSFFAMMGFLGSVIYMIIFQKSLGIVASRLRMVFSPSKIKRYTFLISCWPPAMIWASNLGKDSLCYFSISLFFLSLINFRKNVINVFLLSISMILSYMIRPYLAIVFFFALFFWFIFSSSKQINYFLKVLLLIMAGAVFAFLAQEIAKFGGLSDFTASGLVGRATEQQSMLAEGSHIPVISTHNIFVMFILLPYMMAANLFLPLFVFARNILGLLASFMNIYLIYLSVKFVGGRSAWKSVKLAHPIFSYMFWFFIFGLALLGLINVNLGLADREKLMYLPLFLNIAFVTLLVRNSQKTMRNGDHEE